MIRDEFVNLVRNKRELNFLYKGVDYGIDSMSYDSNWFLYIAYKPGTSKEFKTPDELLDSKIDGRRIIDICEEFEITSIA